jgi:ribonuclease/clavin/mitogillin
LNSLKLILDLSPKTIYPGHGPVVENPREMLEHYISHRQQRSDQIIAALQQSDDGLDPNEITKIVYKVNKCIYLSFIEKNKNLILKTCIQKNMY